MRALILIALAAIGLGCPAPRPPLNECKVSERPIDRMLVEGEPAQITIGLIANCVGGSQEEVLSADQVTVDVRDPDDRPVAFTVSPPRRSPGAFVFDNTAVVSFTPDRPGAWRVSSVFEPGIGRTQQVFQAVERRPDAGVRVVPVNLPTSCTRYGLTTLGTAICTRPGGARLHELFTSRGDKLTGDAFTLEQNSIWRRDATTGYVEHLLDDGLPLRVTHRFGVGTATKVMVQARGDLWLFSEDGQTAAESTFTRVHPEADGGTAFENRSVPRFFARGMVVGAAAVHLYGSGASILSIFLDGGVVQSPAPVGFLAGADEQTLWVSVSPDLVALRPELGSVNGVRVVTATSTPPGDDLALRQSTPVFPLAETSFTDAGITLDVPGVIPRVVPRFDGTAITFESYDVGDDYFPISNATRTQAFARSRDGKTLKIFER